MLNRKNFPSTIFLFAVLFIGSAYWIDSWAVNSGLPLGQTIVFRPFGDRDYLPQVSALARLEFGETSVREMAGSGVRSFPFASVLVHATLVRLWGDPGFVIADLLAFLLYGWMLRYFLTNAGMTRGVAEFVTLLVISGSLNLIVTRLAIYGGVEIPLEFWYPRFPRPLITESFVVAFFTLACRFINYRTTQRSIRAWVLMGTLGACLIQSDIYQAMNVILVCIGLVFYLLTRDSKGVLPGMIVIGATAAVICTPFVYQRLHESPDVLRRWGMIAVGHQLLLVESPRVLAFALSALVVEIMLYCRIRGITKKYAKSAAIITGTAVVCSLLSGPLSVFLLGRGLELYHHVEATELVIGSVVLLCTGWILQSIVQWLYRLLPTDEVLALRIRSAVWVTGVVACSTVAVLSAYAGITQPETPLVREAAPQRHKSSYAELLSELSRPAYKQAQVLGTFDVLLTDWWEYRNKYVYLPDFFSTTVPEHEIECRLYSFMRLMRATPEDFDRVLETPFVLRVIGGKYPAYARYTPWPIYDYSPEAQRRIAGTPMWAWWHLEIPLSERKRLLESYVRFDQLAQPYRQLDVIVLRKDVFRPFLHPETGNVSLAWANDGFEIWLPKQ